MWVYGSTIWCKELVKTEIVMHTGVIEGPLLCVIVVVTLFSSHHVPGFSSIGA